MNRYYFNHLSISEKRYYEKVVHALKRQDYEVGAVFGIYDGSFERVLHAISYDHPEMFYVDFQSLEYTKTLRGISYTPNYRYHSPASKMMLSQIDKIASSVLQAARAAGVRTPYEHLRWIHNYLVKNVKYHDEAARCPAAYPDAFHCFGALVNKHAVCEGISKAFKFLCDKAGLNTFIVSGSSYCADMNQMDSHAWNCAVIDHCFAHIDVTWDINMSHAAQSTRYDYFCVTDADISADHGFSGYPKCCATRLSYFAQTGKLIPGVKSLKEYLAKELTENRKVLYFKVLTGPSAPADLHSKIQDLVEKMIGQYCLSSYSYQTSHNLKQNIFFYQIF